MSPKMRDFLCRAAEVPAGKGIPVHRPDRAIAARAVNAGYGWMIEAPLQIFIIEEAGRTAIEHPPAK